MVIRSVKEPLERLLRIGSTRLARFLARGRSLILVYHNIVPDGEIARGDLPLHLARARFAQQLDILQETHRVVPLDSVLDPDPDTAAGPRIAITFDDGYRGALTAGIAELTKRGLPATVFISSALVGCPSFWWDALPEHIRANTLSLRMFAVTELAGDDSAVRSWAAREGLALREIPDHARPASEEELGMAASLPGITLASHSYAHRNLAKLAPQELSIDLLGSLRWLRRRFDAVLPWLAYPYGISSPAVRTAAADAGFEGAVEDTGGWVPRNVHDRFALPRLSIPAGLSIDGFALRITGLIKQ